jgi:hypothetical protein
MGVTEINDFITSIVNTALPIFISDSIDRIGANPRAENLALSLLGVVVISTLGWLFNAMRQWQSAAAVGNVTLRMRDDAMDAVLRRDLSFYDSFPSGKIVSRVTSDTQAFSSVVMLATDLMSQVLMVFLLIGYLFTVSVSLTLVLLILAPFIVATALAFRRIARNTVTQSRRVNAVVSSPFKRRSAGSHCEDIPAGQAVLIVPRRKCDLSINLRTGYVQQHLPILTCWPGSGRQELVYFGVIGAQAGDQRLGSGSCSSRICNCSGSRSRASHRSGVNSSLGWQR